MLKYEKGLRSVKAALQGELDHQSAARVRQELDELIADEGITTLTLDVSGLTFMDSSGIGVILGRYRLMQKRGGRVRLVGGNPRVDRILEVAGINTIVERER